MVLINIIFCPLLSLLVYKVEKKNLKFDLSVIIIIQIICTSYSIQTIEKGRPLWIVHSIDRFQLIRKNEVVVLPEQYIKSNFSKNIFTGPEYVAVQLSKDQKQKQDDMFRSVFGLTIANQPSRYIPFNTVRYELVKNSQNLEDLYDYNEKYLVDSILKKYPDADMWIPLKASFLDMVVLINKEKAEVVKIVDLRPWN